MGKRRLLALCYWLWLKSKPKTKYGGFFTESLELCFLLFSLKIRYSRRDCYREGASECANARRATGANDERIRWERNRWEQIRWRKKSMTNHEGGKETILAAIRRAAEELGRAPSRGELRRITGISHYKVLAEFPTLREAVRAAGLVPNPKGEKISTEDLLSDWKRVAEKLGRRPSRAGYVREGRYSAGAFVGRFGSWGNIGRKTHHGDAEARRTAKRGSRELPRRTRIGQVPERVNHPFDRLRAGYGHEETQREKRSGDQVIGGSGDRKDSAATRVARRWTKPEGQKREGTQVYCATLIACR
jgi:hypothetical protein